MSRTLELSDQLYTRLEGVARDEGLSTVEELLSKLSDFFPERARRRHVARVDTLRERLRGKYGSMGDSTAEIREDRER